MPTEPDPDAVFSMDPLAVIVAMARQLVEGQQAIAHHARAIDALPPGARHRPQGQALLDQYARLDKSWHNDMLPTIAASMQVALEVHDTFGPGHTEISDPFDAALWNNKWFSAAATLKSPKRSEDDPEGH